MAQNDKAVFVRNFVFGVEDSLVSTVGLLSGVAVVGMSTQEIIVTGIVLIFVEAFSMGAGSWLSEHSVEQYQARQEVSLSQSLRGGIIMFVSYVAAGFIPLLPYFFAEPEIGFGVSIFLTLLALFLLGWGSAKMLRIRAWRGGFQTLIIGGAAVVIGIVVGNIVDRI